MAKLEKPKQSTILKTQKCNSQKNRRWELKEHIKQLDIKEMKTDTTESNVRVSRQYMSNVRKTEDLEKRNLKNKEIKNKLQDRHI